MEKMLSESGITDTMDSGKGGNLDRAREVLRECDSVMQALIAAKPDLDYDAWR
ncbi:MAG: hypothetical protein JO235_12035 [Chroococcidiopsidaceae cyanobacterium CP_BM_RX_35]|nr:hypothetical protein [Chroococcidiopsidaceae cyanobacterium CP_BM_RX_35]